MLRCLRWTMLFGALALTACGGSSSDSGAPGASSGGGPPASTSSSSGASSSSSSSGASGNTVSVTVGPGPTKASSFFNIPSTSLTVCIHGTSTCQTITNVLVDTGSYGLRLLHSALNGLALPLQTDPNTPGNVIAECVPFADGFTWGPVTTADLTIGGETASALPINIIDDDESFSPALPETCVSGTGGSIGTADDLGANGVLGVGVFSWDCGQYCALPVAQQTEGYVYYTCTNTNCAPATEALSSQVINPVALFPKDNNGVILQLPTIPPMGSANAVGTLTFGIATESNNALGSATVLTTDEFGNIMTTYKGMMLNASFLDSGSNGLYFPDSTIPLCTGSTGAAMFYCPTSTLSLTATNQGQNGNSSAVSFQIEALSNFSQSDFAIDDVGGPAASIMGSSNFDFGLPFFYGRSVYSAIQDMPAGSATGPYYAY